MVADFFSKREDSRALFDQLAITDFEEYEANRNQYNVIHIRLNETPAGC